MPIVSRSLFVQALFISALSISTASLAHGPAPAPLNVLQVTEDGTIVLLTSNIGLFHQREGVFQYRCPSLWDENNDGEYDQTTPFAAASASELLVAGDPFVYTSNDDACSFSALPDLDGSSVQSISSTDEDIFLLEENDIGTGIWSRAANAWVWQSTSSLVSLRVANNSLWAAGVDRENENAVLVQLPFSSSGSFNDPFDEVITTSIVSPVDSSSPQHIELRYFDEDSHLWATVTTAGGVELWRIEEGAALKIDEAATAIQGPVPICDGIGYAKEGRLLAVPHHPFTCDDNVLEAETIRCLVQQNGFSFVCFGFEMFRLGENNAVLTTSKSFSFAEIEGPDVSCLAEDEAQRCLSAWAHFGAESGFLDEEPMPDVPAPAGEEPDVKPFGCHHFQASPSSVSWFWGACFLLFLGKRRLRIT